MKADIKVLIMDVDGTLTDGKIYIGENGELMKAFNVKDGCGIHDILIPRGIMPIIITGRNSEIVNQRCKELDIKNVYQNVKDKTQKLNDIISNLNISMESVAYIGDDINDLSCMKLVKANGGLIGCPANAVNAVKEIAQFISCYNGGDGAVRDFIEWLIYR